MVFASFRSDFTLYKAKFLENAVVTSENSWCDVTQSEGGAVTGPNWTTAPRLAKKSMTSHESLISHCARICYKKKKKKKFRIWKKKNHNAYAHGAFTILNWPTFSNQHSGLSNPRLKIMSTNVFGSMMHDLARNCRIEQRFSFKKTSACMHYFRGKCSLTLK
jgi:hypothetical protein